MRDHRFGGEHQLALTHPSITQIPILAGGEREPLVEASKSCQLQPRERKIVAAKKTWQNRVRFPVLVKILNEQLAAPRIDVIPRGIHDFSAGPDVRLGCKHGVESFQPRWIGNAVVIQEHNVLAYGCRQSGIARPGRAAVAETDRAEVHAGLKRRQRFRGRRLTAIIHYDDFEFTAGVTQLRDCFQAPAEVSWPIVCRNHDREFHGTSKERCLLPLSRLPRTQHYIRNRHLSHPGPDYARDGAC